MVASPESPDTSGHRPQREAGAHRAPRRGTRRPPATNPALRQSRRRGRTHTTSWVFAIIAVCAAGALLVLSGVTLGGPSAAPGPTALSVAPPMGLAPVAPTRPSAAVDLIAGTAALPPGAGYTPAGRGTWHVVPANPSPPQPDQARARKAVTYTVETEDGLDPASYAGDDAFARDVDATLSDPRGWSGLKNITLRRIGGGTPDLRVSLTSPLTTQANNLCGFDIRYEGSCFEPATSRVVINLARWTRGALAYQGDLNAYRAYAINHEVGHALGEDHRSCPAPGAAAPVMMQQTYGTENAYVHQLDQADPAGHDSVPNNPITCRPNPWPADSQRP
jgi:hypothetical protein